MISKNLAELFNNQINKELESAYSYMAFAEYFHRCSLDGFAHWYEVQSAEETGHAQRFICYLRDMDEPVIFSGINAESFPDEDSIVDILQAGLEHEQEVTALIVNIYKNAEDEKDYAAMRFLDWFITEQVEEEKLARDLIAMCDSFICDCGCGLYELNQELAKRECESFV